MSRHLPPLSGRTILINVESNIWGQQYKIWPHLGLLTIGTIVEESGYEAILWDELREGPFPLDWIKEGDIIGLSLVVTGIERGVELAREAKRRGAAYVIAGNDAARFRARQILKMVADSPIDAVFTSDSLIAVSVFFRKVRKLHSTEHWNIPGVATRYGSAMSTDKELFKVPNLKLFGPAYWEKIHQAYRSQFGHKHSDRDGVKNALIQLSHGCGRASAGGGKKKCKFCGIGGVEQFLMPGEDYLTKVLETYQDFGVNTFFNVADSSLEMVPLLSTLEKMRPSTMKALNMYGRAQTMATKPELIERWANIPSERLLINCGLESIDETILQHGIEKAASKTGSRADENWQAIRNIKAAGSKVHLHCSVIFGSPGETRDSCERTLGFIKSVIGMLGTQLDVCEPDSWWPNFGSPSAQVYRDYDEAQRLAAIAGKTISPETWHKCFERHADDLVVSKESLEAWFQLFTSISLEEALDFCEKVALEMDKVPGRIEGRTNAFQPKLGPSS